MEDPSVIIKRIKVIVKEECDDNKTLNPEELLTIFSADLCSLLLKKFPGSTIMMKKDFKSCATLINGVVYDAYGPACHANYFIAGLDEVNYIKTMFNRMPTCMTEKIEEALMEEGPYKASHQL